MKKVLDLTNTMEFPPLMSKKEIEAIQDALFYISRSKQPHNPFTIVELGCYSGGTTIIMAKTIPEAKIYAIDIFAINGSDIRDFVISKRFPECKNIELLEMTTVEASRVVPDGFDFIFIDADHQQDSIERDCDNWLPKLKSGGIVVFDDYNNDDFPAIAPVVESRTTGWKIYGQHDTIMIKIKP